jgi:hypothetical protein
MIDRAFDLGLVRVEFKTDARNERSRAALAALPARFEGVLRAHMRVPDIGLRDSAYFSVLADEWPDVAANLERRLARRRRGTELGGPGTAQVPGSGERGAVRSAGRTAPEPADQGDRGRAAAPSTHLSRSGSPHALRVSAPRPGFAAAGPGRPSGLDSSTRRLVAKRGEVR